MASPAPVGAAASPAVVESAASRAVVGMALSYVSQWRQERMQSWRSFAEFANSRRLGMPAGGVIALKQRVFSNATYFLTNYLVVAVAFGVLTLLLRPLLAMLISMPLVLYAYLFVYHRETSMTLPGLGTPVGDREKWIAVSVVFGLVFLYAASDLVWIVGATACVVAVHAVFYKSREEHETDTLFQDEAV